MIGVLFGWPDKFERTAGDPGVAVSVCSGWADPTVYSCSRSDRFVLSQSVSGYSRQLPSHVSRSRARLGPASYWVRLPMFSVSGQGAGA